MITEPGNLLGIGGALVVALTNLWFVKRWVESVDERLKAQDVKIDDRTGIAISRADSAKRRVFALETVMQVKGCTDLDTCPIEADDQDSHPSIRATGRHRIAV
jgi:hypothetical protein